MPSAAQSRPRSPPPTLLEQQARVLEQVVRGEPLPAILTALCKVVEQQATRPVRAAILLLDPDGRRLRTGAAPSLPAPYSAAVDGIAIDAGYGTCTFAALERRVVVTPSFADDPSWAPMRDLVTRHGLAAAWSMPIQTASGEVLGTFGTYYLAPTEPTAAERELVEVLARTAAIAIERRRNDEELAASVARHRFLSELDRAMQPLLEPAEMMATAARMLAEHLDADRCAYAEIEDENVFVITGDYSRGVPTIVGRWPVAAFGEPCVRAMRAGEAYIVDDVERDERLAEADRAAYRATQIASVICVPLHKAGRFTAGMAVHQATPRAWTTAERELVPVVAARCWESLERARVTRTLRASELRYRTIVEGSPECVKLVAPDGRLLQMNSAGLRMVGADSDRQVLGACVFDLIAPEHRERFRAFHDRICAGEEGTLEFEIVGLGGQRRIMETTAVPLPGEDGRTMQLALTRDVSQRVAAERALADSRARLEYAVRLSGVGFWYCDLPFSELIWDAQVRQHFFVEPDERVTIETFYERLHPDDRDPTRAAIDASIARHEPYDVIYRTVHPTTGEVKAIRALGGAAYANDGKPIRFDGVTVDVTRERADQARLQSLLDRERRHARCLQQIAAAAAAIHAAPTEAAVREATIDAARRVLESADAEIREGVVPAPAHGLEALLPDRGGHAFSTLLVTARDGQRFDDADAAVLSQLAQHAVVALDNARLHDRLREQDRRKDEFLATLAHELRNPLSPIRNGVEILGRAEDRGVQARTLQMMQRQLSHLVRMVDDLLEVSRITQGKLVLQQRPMDLREALDAAVESAAPILREREHDFDIRLPVEPLPVHGDATRLAQVVANLLHNAAKYTPRGGRIRVEARARDGNVEIEVADSGVGIPSSMIERIFDPFLQVERSIDQAQGGLGIGLTLVQRLVRLHGGSVEAFSDGADRGSRFIVTLPRANTPVPSVA